MSVQLSKLQIVRKEIYDSVDSETGEVLYTEEKKHCIVTNTPKEYFIVYSSFIGVMKDLSGGAVKVMAYLVNSAPINDNSVYVNSVSIPKIQDSAGISAAHVKRCVKELVDKGILSKAKVGGRSGCYIIHPDYFWKGDMRGRNNAIRTMLEVRLEPNKQ